MSFYVFVNILKHFCQYFDIYTDIFFLFFILDPHLCPTGVCVFNLKKSWFSKYMKVMLLILWLYGQIVGDPVWMRGGPGVRAPAPHYLEGSQVIILNCICAFICFPLTYLLTYWQKSWGAAGNCSGIFGTKELYLFEPKSSSLHFSENLISFSPYRSF